MGGEGDWNVSHHKRSEVERMEKSKSFPQYSSSSSYSAEYHDFQDGSKSYVFNGPTNSKKNNQGFSASNDPELKRKKRIAAYNMFTTEGKLKSTMRESFKWIKTNVRYGL